MFEGVVSVYQVMNLNSLTCPKCEAIEIQCQAVYAASFNEIQAELW